MALAFVIAHPGVTSAILGPRTMEQLDDLLAGAQVRLSDELLDAIDAIVPPGTELNDDSYAATPPALTERGRRRR